MSKLKGILCVLLLWLLAACGGGGGSAGTTGSGSTSGGTPTSSVTPTVTVSTPTLVVGIYNSSGAAVSDIAIGGGFVARATLKDAAGAVVASKLVTFSLNGASIAQLSPLTSLTNSSGVAEVAVAPASISSLGAATIVANANVAGIDVTGEVDFSVQSSSLSLSSLTVGSSNLQSAGNTPIQVTARIGSAVAVGVPVNVTFSASCGRINAQDTTSAGVSITTNGSGVAAAVYDAAAADGSLCTGPVTITASSAGATSLVTTVNVAAPTASAMVFVSATPAQLFVAGSGAVDQAVVRFRVLSSTGVALPSVPVKFSIVTNPGGVGIGVVNSTAPVTATTLASGEASISIFSGGIPGPVKVRAELVSNAATFAESQNLTVASGPPSQRFMSLSVETFNIEGWNLDGTNTQLTVRVADRQGNAVDDGTVVNFTAEGGQVARSCATQRVAGISQCSVTFESQNPRPAGGRASVLAYLEGTKDYVDNDGNNRYAPSVDTLMNIGDAYRDDNENGIYNPSLGEFLIPRGGTVACASAGAPFPSRADTCDTTDKLATTVRQQTVILFSSTNPVFDNIVKSTSGIEFRLRSADNLLLPMPAGTVVAAEVVDTNSTDGATCTLVSVAGTPIPNIPPTTNPLADLSTRHEIALKDCRSGDAVIIKVTVPSRLENSIRVNL